MNGAQKIESPLAGGLFDKNQSTENTPIINDSPEDSKAAATLIAKFSLAGYAVHRVEDGYLVCRWNFSRHCEDLRALVGFARQVGVQS